MFKMQATEEAARQRMALSFDVLWRIGKNHIDDPRDLFALASTCRSLWYLLEDEVYIADVLLAQAVHSPRTRCICDLDGSATDVEDRHYQWCETVHHILRGPFHAAAQRGDVIRVRRFSNVALALWSPYIDMKDPEGYSPLLLAARNGHLEVVKLLREAGCYTDAHVIVPLQTAGQIAGRPNLDLVFGPPFWNDAPIMTHNPLTLAIAAGHEELAKYLIDYTEIYDMHVKVPDFWVPLLSAHSLAVLAQTQSVFERLNEMRPFVGTPRYQLWGRQALFIAATYEGSYSMMSFIVSCRVFRFSITRDTTLEECLDSREGTRLGMLSLRAAILARCPSNALWILKKWDFQPEFFQVDQFLYVQMAHMLDLCLDADKPELFVVASQILRCIPDTVAPEWTFTGSDYLRWAVTAGVDHVDRKGCDHQVPRIAERGYWEYNGDFALMFP